MMIKQVQDITGLSRKAIEYYQQKGLIKPEVKENGYREYSMEQVEALRHIALLRNLDVPLDEIKSLLQTKEGRGNLLRERQIEMDRQQRKTILLEEYAQNGPTQALRQKVEALIQEESLAQRFLRLIPGYMGQMLMVNFVPFLRDPARTEDEEEIFQEALAFLDSMPPAPIPDDLAQELDKLTDDFPLSFMESAQAKKVSAIHDAENWIEQNEQFIKEYEKLKQTDEYRQLPVVQTSDLLKEYFKTTGYYERFIPLMRRLSPKYNEYYEALIRADEILKEKRPD